MKNSKRIISLLLAVLMTAMMLSSCGGSTVTQATKASADATVQTTAATTVEQTAANTEIKLPDVELTNKKIVIYQFSPDLYRSEDVKHPSVIDIMEKEYGAQFETVNFEDWSKQYEKLVTLYMANNMPDVIDNADFPVAVADGLIVASDKYIDYTNPMWDSARSVLEANKWNGHYYICNTSPLSTSDWTYFNPQFFEANNMKSPLEYWKENAWDWNAAMEIAKQTTLDTDDDGKIDQWGLGMSSIIDLHTQTGVPLVGLSSDGKMTLNLRDPKIEAAATFFKALGPSGNNVLNREGGEVEDVEFVIAGKMALGIVGWWAGVQDSVKAGWQKGVLDFVPLPKWPGEATNYVYGQMRGLGIANKAKNPEGAALYLEVSMFCNTDAYRAKYCPEDDPTINLECKNAGMNDEQLKRLYDLNQSYKTMPVCPVRHWVVWDWDDGFEEALAQPWSQVVEVLEPRAQKAVDTWQEKLNGYK